MTQRYRLLAVDVDGTLMNRRNQLPAAHREALHRAHAAGLKVCLCTGRSYTEARGVLDELGLDLDAGVFVFGAVVVDLPARQTLWRTTIPARVAGQVVQYLQTMGHPVLVLLDALHAGHDYLLLPGTRHASAYEAWIARSPAQIRRVEHFDPDAAEAIRIGIIEDRAAMEQTRDALESAFPPHVLKCNAIYAPNYDLAVVEAFAPQVNKWYGVRHLCRRWSIEPEQVAAIGDDVNDLELLSHVGLGIAMGNAVPRVKAVSKWVVPDHDADGLAVAVDRLLAGQGDDA